MMQKMRGVEAELENSKLVKGVEGFFSEFGKFIARGNILDLAIGVVIGTAFNAIVNSLVTDIITPFLGLASTNADLNTWQYTLRAPFSNNGTTTPALVVNYGHLVQVSMNFVIIGLCIFIFFKLITMVREHFIRKEKAAPAEPISTEEKLLCEIRDLLREQVEHLKPTHQHPQNGPSQQ